MGWTTRLEYKSDFHDIVEYLKSMNNFHDYRLGHIEYKAHSATIMIEEVIPNAKPQDDAGLVWNFVFEGVNIYEHSIDCGVGSWITEVEGDDTLGEILFDLTSGHIRIVADNITLGIPSPA